MTVCPDYIYIHIHAIIDAGLFSKACATIPEQFAERTSHINIYMYIVRGKNLGKFGEKVLA